MWLVRRIPDFIAFLMIVNPIALFSAAAGAGAEAVVGAEEAVAATTVEAANVRAIISKLGPEWRKTDILGSSGLYGRRGADFIKF